MKEIGNYIAEDTPIGTGGMGRVLRGTSKIDGRPVALKEILPEFVADLEFRSRVEGEINFLKSLDHDNVVKVYESFEHGDNMYIVMELVEGLNIEQKVMRDGPLPWNVALSYMRIMLDTMQYVHDRGIVHRDIKPSNIMILPNGQIRILDFGVAKDVSERNQYGTVIGTIIGTDGYMSPEQAEGMSIDHRSDIYSLGCVLFYMLTGTHAYDKKAADYQTKANIIYSNFPHLSDRIQGVPDWLDTLIAGAVEKNMMTRYASCREFGQKLQIMATNISKPDAGTSVSVGRLDCDIIVGINNTNVSRHHLDVTVHNDNGREFLLFEDRSSNGTVFNGHKYNRGERFMIPRGAHAEIYLAGQADACVLTEQIDELLSRKLKEGTLQPVGDMLQQYHQQQPHPYRMNPENGLPDNIPYTPAYPNQQQVNPQQMPQQQPQVVNQQMFNINVGVPYHQAFPPTHTMGFGEAIRSVYGKYATFTGRASRAEFWWFYLFNILVVIGIYAICAVIGFASDSLEILVVIPILTGLFYLINIIPSFALFVRRMHDVGKSGWSWLWSLVPIFGGIYLFIQEVTKGEPYENSYGVPPGYE